MKNYLLLLSILTIISGCGEKLKKEVVKKSDSDPIDKLECKEGEIEFRSEGCVKKFGQIKFDSELSTKLDLYRIVTSKDKATIYPVLKVAPLKIDDGKPRFTIFEYENNHYGYFRFDLGGNKYLKNTKLVSFANKNGYSLKAPNIGPSGGYRVEDELCIGICRQGGWIIEQMPDNNFEFRPDFRLSKYGLEYFSQISTDFNYSTKPGDIKLVVDFNLDGKILESIAIEPKISCIKKQGEEYLVKTDESCENYWN